MMAFSEMFDDVKRMDKRQFFYQVLSFGMIVSSALMIWKGLMVVTGKYLYLKYSILICHSFCLMKIRMYKFLL